MYQCPNCKTDDNLSIFHDLGCRSRVDKDANVIESIVGDSDWLETDDAQCGHCDWEGTVEDMTIEDEETQAEDAKEREEDRPCTT